MHTTTVISPLPKQHRCRKQKGLDIHKEPANAEKVADHSNTHEKDGFSEVPTSIARDLSGLRLWSALTDRWEDLIYAMIL